MNPLPPATADIDAEPRSRPAEPPPFQQLLHSSAAKQDLCVLAVLTWIAACDGRIDAKEQELLRRVAEGSDGSADLAAVVQIIRLCRPKDIEAACRFLRNHCSRGDQRLLARLAVAMAVQDGRLTIGENLVLQFLADLLGIRPRAFAKLFEEIARRPFPNPGDPSDPAWWRLRESGGQTAADYGSPAYARETGTASDGGDEDEPMTRTEALHLLGLTEGTSPRLVHDAYRRLAKARHPDRFAPLGPAAVATATFAFEQINNAYAILKQG